MENTNQVKIKPIIGWCFYDWANSSYPTLIITFIFATYFTKSIAPNTVIGTTQWGEMIGFASLIIAILSPVLGSIADHIGQRKPWIASFTMLAVITSTLLWFSYPKEASTNWTLYMVGIGTVSFEVGMVFYNAMLRDLAPPAFIGRISGWAWGLGYFGGLLSLIIALVFFIEMGDTWFSLDKQTAEQIRIAGPFVGLWFAVFSLPFFIYTPDNPRKKITYKKAVNNGLKMLLETFQSLKTYKNIFIFLIARMIYIDGLNTLFAFGGIFAAGTFGMDFAEVLKFGIAMNITAGIGAISFAWLDDQIGPKRTILISLVGLTICGITIVFTEEKLIFWIFALILGLFVGPTQAASRSLMARLAPEDKINEMFGLYALSGKATAFLGPWLLALVTSLTQSQRFGIASVLFFFIVGGVLLCVVKENMIRY